MLIHPEQVRKKSLLWVIYDEAFVICLNKTAKWLDWLLTRTQRLKRAHSPPKSIFYTIWGLPVINKRRRGKEIIIKQVNEHKVKWRGKENSLIEVERKSCKYLWSEWEVIDTLRIKWRVNKIHLELLAAQILEYVRIRLQITSTAFNFVCLCTQHHFPHLPPNVMLHRNNKATTL